jgi:predicted nuclease with RNAse H fold
VDVAEARKGLDLVALDEHRRIVTTAKRLSISDVSQCVAALQPMVVCIDAPSGWAKQGRSRLAERQLRRLGVSAFCTPTDPGEHPFYRWIRVGFAVYAAIESSHRLYQGGSVAGVAAEVFPAASAVLLAGGLRDTETKVRFRRRVLDNEGVDETALSNLDQVDAALGALTGVYALEGRASTVGDPAEGVILLPVPSVPVRPLSKSPGPCPTGSTRPSQFVQGTTGSSHTCLCGCGAAVRRRFLPGHDAKLKSRLLAAHRMGDADATRRLSELGWLRT